jgi:hypothetical protein
MQQQEPLCSLEMTRPLKALKHGNDDYEAGVTGHKGVV